jgi:hypothetical protein
MYIAHRRAQLGLGVEHYFNIAFLHPYMYQQLACMGVNVISTLGGDVFMGALLRPFEDQNAHGDLCME